MLTLLLKRFKIPGLFTTELAHMELVTISNHVIVDLLTTRDKEGQNNQTPVMLYTFIY